MLKVGILGIPFNGDGTPPEIENPAAALREAGISSIQISNDCRVLDFGDLDIPVSEGIRDQRTKVLNLKAWTEISRQTAEKLRSIQTETDFTIVLGGDCAILLGICGAFHLADSRVGIVSLDGHTDYREPAFSSTGEPADLEMAILTGKGPRELTGLFGAPPLIQPSDVVICGYREPDLIMDAGIHHFDSRAFRNTGAEKLANKALLLLEDLDRLWFHLDVDVLDPSIMPVCFPEPGGLRIDETEAFISTVIGSDKFIGMSIACYHPNLDSELKAASSIVAMLASALSSTT